MNIIIESDQNEPGAHAHHRIAEAVSSGWPAYETNAEEVEKILELAREGLEAAVIGVRLERGVPLLLIEAVLAEASTYEGLVAA